MNTPDRILKPSETPQAPTQHYEVRRHFRGHNGGSEYIGTVQATDPFRAIDLIITQAGGRHADYFARLIA